MILNENDYQAFVASIDLLSLHCPVCGVVGLFILYGHYKRFVIIDDISSGDCKIEIPVQRIQCTQCKSTHALLPTNFVPYTQFTYLFIYYIVTLDENDDLITSFEVALQTIRKVKARVIEFWDSLFPDWRNFRQNDLKIESLKCHNSHFKSYMNYYDLRKKLLEINNDLTICYSLKLELVDFYSKSTIDNAKVNLEILIRSFIDTNIEEMIKFSNNLINWKQEIINSFTIVGAEYKVEADKGQVVVCNKKVNNAIIENRNKIIKCIKNNANGYTNWLRFRNRVMYVLDPNATFSLEPKEK